MRPLIDVVNTDGEENIIEFIIDQQTQTKTMTTSEIKIGVKFQNTESLRVYEITRISNVSVWFRDITRTPTWRIAKTTLNDYLSKDTWRKA